MKAVKSLLLCTLLICLLGVVLTDGRSNSRRHRVRISNSDDDDSIQHIIITDDMFSKKQEQEKRISDKIIIKTSRSGKKKKCKKSSKTKQKKDKIIVKIVGGKKKKKSKCSSKCASKCTFPGKEIVVNVPIVQQPQTIVVQRPVAASSAAANTKPQNVNINFELEVPEERGGRRRVIVRQPTPIPQQPPRQVEQPPKQPETPTTPVEPTQPETPSTPVTPVTPTQPETPKQPETPSVPVTPVTPPTPVTPTVPTTPVTPVTPSVPVTPTPQPVQKKKKKKSFFSRVKDTYKKVSKTVNKVSNTINKVTNTVNKVKNTYNQIKTVKNRPTQPETPNTPTTPETPSTPTVSNDCNPGYVPSQFPIFKQCDSQWGSVHLGTSSSTICKAGCLLSAMAAGLKGLGKSNMNPRDLNQWLKDNRGFSNGNLFAWASVNKLGVRYSGRTSDIIGVASRNVCSGRLVILKLKKPPQKKTEHFVLATGYNAETKEFSVVDSAFNRQKYLAEEIERSDSYTV